MEFVYYPEEETMIKIYLSDLMGKHKVKISDVSKETGIHRNTLTSMYYEKVKRVEVDVLDRLCLYFNCKLSDLIDFIEEE